MSQLKLTTFTVPSSQKITAMALGATLTAALRFEGFTCGAILGRSGHHPVQHTSKNWGGYSQPKSLLNNLLHWPTNFCEIPSANRKMPHKFGQFCSPIVESRSGAVDLGEVITCFRPFRSPVSE
jgi:hypothetical protein